MADLKTKPTPVDPDAFIEAVDNPRRREDAKVVRALFGGILGEPPVMWGPTIVGFGRYRYTYDSGHSGEMPLLGFAPRGSSLVVYLDRSFDGADALVARLGKVKLSKGCIYINRLGDVDLGALRELAIDSVASTRARYPG